MQCKTMSCSNFEVTYLATVIKCNNVMSELRQLFTVIKLNSTSFAIDQLHIHQCRITLFYTIVSI